MSAAAAEVLAAYRGSDADRTRALYAKLSALGPAGEIAVNLLRSSKTSERAKTYRRRSSRGAAYDTKGWAMGNLAALLAAHAGALGVAWGWGPDDQTPGFPWVFYCELPGHGQCSFHARERGDGPDYGRPWDGVRGVSGQRACAWAAQLLEGKSDDGKTLHKMRSNEKPGKILPAQNGAGGSPFLVQDLFRPNKTDEEARQEQASPEQPIHALQIASRAVSTDASRTGLSLRDLPQTTADASNRPLSQNDESTRGSLSGMQFATPDSGGRRPERSGDQIPRRIRAATCFSGIGAPECAASSWDWKWCAEVEAFPSAVLAFRHPRSINLGDVTAPDFLERATAAGPIDVLVGGPPCQSFSVAGLRKSLNDDRGNLSLRWVRIIHAVRPLYAVTENVPGWLSTEDNAFGCFLGGLVGADAPLRSPLERGRWPDAGMVAGPLARACWRVCDAQYSGVPQRRRRVFVVAGLGDGTDPSQILFESQSVCGNFAPSRETGERAAPTISARPTAGGGLGTDSTGD